jgi:hypothetical protein
MTGDLPHDLLEQLREAAINARGDLALAVQLLGTGPGPAERRQRQRRNSRRRTA